MRWWLFWLAVSALMWVAIAGCVIYIIDREGNRALGVH